MLGSMLGAMHRAREDAAASDPNPSTMLGSMLGSMITTAGSGIALQDADAAVKVPAPDEADAVAADRAMAEVAAMPSPSRKSWQWRQERLKAKLSSPAAAWFDISDWTEQSSYTRALGVASCLSQKGFCLIKGTLASDLRAKGLFEAREHFINGSFDRPPLEALSGLCGEIGSAWTLELGDPNAPAGTGSQALRQVEEFLWAMGTEVASCTQAAFGMRLASVSGGLLHRSRTTEEREPNPPLTDLEEADYYIDLFSQRKLKFIYYIGPSPATLHVLTIGEEAQACGMHLEAGSILVLRADACRCAIHPRSMESAHIVEVSFLADAKQDPQAAADRIPLPVDLHEWYLGRLQAIVENDVTDGIPMHWLKSAREMFFKSSPVRIREIAYDLPTSGTADWTCPFSGIAFGGYDAIVEIPKSKWDLTIYYDDDPMGANDFKMYSRHIGILDGDPVCPEDFMPSELLPAGEAKSAHQMMCSSSMQGLHLAGLGKKDVQGKPMGVFCGASGNDVYYQLLAGEVKLGKDSFAELGNAGLANRLSHALGSTGPSLVIDTEDSSGSCAVDTAVAYIRQDRCDQALAGGVNSVRHPFAVVLLCAAGKLSRNGRSRVFEQSCDGFVAGEGVVTTILEAHSWRRKRKEEDVFATAEERDDDTDGQEPNQRALIMGSALNSSGSSVGFAAPSAPSLMRCIRRAMEDAQHPAAIVDAVEASASGNALADAVEFAAVRTELQGAEELPAPLIVRAFKSSIGEIGVPSGLAALARGIVAMEHAAHGPSLHVHQLFEMAGVTCGDIDDELEPSDWRVLVNTELVGAASRTQTVGVSSFGSSGTNVHHVLWGIKRGDQLDTASSCPIHWFPAVMMATESDDAEYHIVGTWTAWEKPQKMEVESPGVFVHTVVLGENRWETFQIWANGNPDQVLHPDTQWAGRDSEVCGPSAGTVCGRFLTWRINGKPEKVRLINEEQARRLKEAGEEPEEIVAVAFKGDTKPCGHEGARDITEMPTVQPGLELSGVPGDRYTVRLQVQGKYRRVEWSKLAADPTSQMPAEEHPHCYYIVGSHNYWTFSAMEPSADGHHAAEVKLLDREAKFQVVRDRDWDQMFYPRAAKESMEEEDANIRGPDGYGLGKTWLLEGQIGDVFRVDFQRVVDIDGNDSTRVACALLQSAASSTTSQAALTASLISGAAAGVEDARNVDHSYYLVGSWSSFTQLQDMDYDEAAGAFTAEVTVGKSGREEFQILLNKNWLSAVHPNSPQASYLDEDHKLRGPDDVGAHSHWSMGSHQEDSLRPGDRVTITMSMSAGLPLSISWRRSLSKEE